MRDDLGPFNLDLERAVIAGLVTAPDLKQEIAEIVSFDDFTDRRHQTIFRAVMALDGRKPDLLTLMNFLQQKGEEYLQRAGGEDYLLDLAADPPSFLLIRQYCQQVAELARQRRLMQNAAKITQLANSGDVQGALDLARKMAEEEQPSRAGWPWRSLKDAYQPREPRQYVILGLWPIPSVDTIYGPPGTLKTMFMQDGAICVAGGKPWLAGLPDSADVLPFEVMQAPVLWIDLDNGLDRTERRFAALGKAHDILENAPLAYVSFPAPPFIASDEESVQRALGAVQATGAKLVVFDNLGAVSGGADENSSQMVAVMSGLRQIAELGECAVVVIHHKSKGDRARPGDSLRGHSSIEAAVDLALLVERDGEDDTITLRSTKTRDIPVKPFSALWTYEQDSAGELTKGRFFGLGRPEGQPLNKQQEAELCILKHMTNGMNQTAIIDLVKREAGIGRHTTIAAVKRLVDSGELYARVGQAHGAIEYDKAK